MTKNLTARVDPLPEPPKKPTGSKQQVGRIIIKLENGQTETLKVYWYGEEVTSQGDRPLPNVEAIREMARTLFEQMQKNPEVKNPIQTEIAVEYAQDWADKTNFKLLSAQYVPKAGTPSTGALPAIPKPAGMEEIESSKMPTFTVVERLVHEILSRPATINFRQVKTGEDLTIEEAGKNSLRAVVTPLTEDGKEAAGAEGRRSVELPPRVFTDQEKAKAQSLIQQLKNIFLSRQLNTWIQAMQEDPELYFTELQNLFLSQDISLPPWKINRLLKLITQYLSRSTLNETLETNLNKLIIHLSLLKPYKKEIKTFTPTITEHQYDRDVTKTVSLNDLERVDVQYYATLKPLTLHTITSDQPLPPDSIRISSTTRQDFFRSKKGFVFNRKQYGGLQEDNEEQFSTDMQSLIQQLLSKNIPLEEIDKALFWGLNQCTILYVIGTHRESIDPTGYLMIPDSSSLIREITLTEKDGHLSIQYAFTIKRETLVNTDKGSALAANIDTNKTITAVWDLHTDTLTMGS